MQLFVHQMERLKARLIPIGHRVEQLIDTATRTVIELNAKQAQIVLDTDQTVFEDNAMFEEMCLSTLALHQPVALDLRQVIAYVKIKEDLNRMTELAISLCEDTVQLAQLPPIQPPMDLAMMGSTTRKMVRMAQECLVNLDASQARMVRALDDLVDDVHRQMYETLEQRIVIPNEPIKQLLLYHNVSRSLERIADLSTRIAKDVIYQAEGRIVRHRKARGLSATD